MGRTGGISVSRWILLRSKGLGLELVLGLGRGLACVLPLGGVRAVVVGGGSARSRSRGDGLRPRMGEGSELGCLGLGRGMGISVPGLSNRDWDRLRVRVELNPWLPGLGLCSGDLGTALETEALEVQWRW